MRRVRYPSRTFLTTYETGGGCRFTPTTSHHISFKDEAVKKRLFITVGTVVKSVETKSAAEAIPATPLFIMRYAYVVGSGYETTERGAIKISPAPSFVAFPSVRTNVVPDSGCLL